MSGWHKGETAGNLDFPPAERRLWLGMIGGGPGAWADYILPPLG